MTEKEEVEISSTYLKYEPRMVPTDENSINVKRTILINPNNISSTDFNITVGDSKYNYLLNEGYNATLNYFNS